MGSSDHPGAPISTAGYPHVRTSAITLDFPVPDILVSRMRFIAPCFMVSKTSRTRLRRGEYVRC
jgi:hypothetical protein